jgi:hypothetical protein
VGARQIIIISPDRRSGGQADADAWAIADLSRKRSLVKLKDILIFNNGKRIKN